MMASSAKNVFKNSIIYSFGNVAQKGYSVFITIIASRFLLTEEFGKVALINLIETFVTMTVVSTISGAVMRFYVDLEGEAKQKFIGTTIIFLHFIALLIISIISIDGQTLMDFLFPKSQMSFYPLFFMGLLIVFFNTPFIVANSVFRIKEEPMKMFKVQLISLILNIFSISIFLVLLKGGLIGLIKGQLLASMIMSFIYFYYLRHELIFCFSWKLMKPALKFSLPLLPYVFLAYVRDSSDRFFLEKHVNLSHIGIYFMAVMLTNLIGIVISGLAAAYSPRMYNLIKEKGVDIAKKELSPMATQIIFIVFVVYALISIFAKEILFLFAPKSYQKAYIVVPVLGLGVFFRGIYLLFHNSFYWTNKTSYVSWITFFATLATVLGLVLLIPITGIMGAGYGIVFGQVVGVILAYIWGQKVFPLKYDLQKLTPVFLIGVSLIFTSIYLIDFPLSLFYFIMKSLIFAIIFITGWQTKIIKSIRISFFNALSSKKNLLK